MHDFFPIREIIMHGAGRFLQFKKSSCTVQGVFPNSENRHARCMAFSQTEKLPCKMQGIEL
jgi:hypothetical protein